MFPRSSMSNWCRRESLSSKACKCRSPIFLVSRELLNEPLSQSGVDAIQAHIYIRWSRPLRL